MKNKGVLFVAQAGLIAALYVTLTYVFAAISFGEVQLRIAEALTILPMFTPAAIPGLFVGCIIGNAMGGAVMPDIICGSLATLAGAYGTWMLRGKSPMIACLPPIIANMIVVPFVLRYAYAVSLPLWFMALTVGAGEVLGCGILGCVLYFAVYKNREAIFKPGIGENN